MKKYIKPNVEIYMIDAITTSDAETVSIPGAEVEHWDGSKQNEEDK